MKNATLLITLIAVAAFAAGCDQDRTTSERIDKANADTKAAARNLSYTFGQKAEFVKLMQDQLNDLNQDLDQLSAKIDRSSDVVKAGAKPRLEALRDHAAEFDRQLDGARNATEATWESAKNGCQKACASTREDSEQSSQWVSDKIARR